ncbi:hypothetical protein [uncultured Flavobacterium sp.]|uniref:hypothetical protein n=1 Tax=uncultured Flavobacterium sp. TaxID=165435 RepID=UPI0025D0CB97|nr:hypothetical protein [uncultured Flavobacterium sp.]
MKTIKDINTDGVLVVANVTKLKGQFNESNKFNYDYPEGLAGLIEKGIIHITTTESDVKSASFTLEINEIDMDKWKVHETYNCLDIAEGDEVRILSHGDFTRTCDWKHGDFDEYAENGFFNKAVILERSPKIALPAGYYRVHTYTKTKLRKYAAPHFIFFLEPADKAATATITLQPVSYFSS